MSVIIRLQNLPWSANAMDIRNFFRGLSIPEGGVHIVGGEQGDAFIAFSTDEDARQGMLNNGGRIKEVQVKLLLSSRSEMLKVIETARQAVTFMQMASQPALPAQPVVTQPSAVPTSITGILAQNLKQLQQLPGLPLPNVITTNIVKPMEQQSEQKDSSRNNKDSKFDRRRSRSSSRDRHKKERSRDSKKDKRDRSRSRDRSRDRDRRRRDRSRSRERRDRKRDRKDRSRDRDRSKDRSDRFKDDKKNDNSKDASGAFVPKSITTNIRPGGDNVPRKRFGGWSNEAGNAPTQPAVIPNSVTPYMNQNNNPRMGWTPEAQQMVPPNPNMGMQMPNPNVNNMMNMNNPAVPNNLSSPSSLDDQTRINELVERRNPNAFQLGDNNFPSRGGGDRDGRSRSNGTSEGYFGRGNSRFRPNNYNNRHDSSFRNNRYKVTLNSCLKVSNLSDRTLYKDIRRFFTGLFIPNSGLKLINNQYGKYTGVAYVRFSSPEDKFEALKRSGRVLNGHNVVIEHLDDTEYDNALDLYVPSRSGRDSTERDEELDSSQDLVIVENDEELDKDKTFKVLYLEDLPPFAKEQDIMKMFSDYSLLSILLLTSKDVRKQYVAYVQFVHANDAKAALTDKSKHLIGHIAIKVSPCSDSTYEEAKQHNAEQEMEENVEDTQQDQDMEMEPSPPPPVHVTRDPRQRRVESKPPESVPFNNSTPYQAPLIPNPPMQPGMYSWRANNPPIIPNAPNPAAMMPDRERMPFGGSNHFSGPPQRPSRFHVEPVLDCIFIKGLPLSATDKDVLNLFADLNVTPTRIHLMLTLQGEPSGDCFCEFTEAGEASAAVTKNGSMVGINRVSLELVPKSVVNDALGIPNPVNNYGGDRGGGMGRGGYRGRGGPPRGRGRGWGGRDFHSRGGRGGSYGGPPPPAVHSNEPTEGFGSPGTVVSMENVPYRATINEILDFFHGFNISQQDIIRRFNENGQPTGDARVNMHTTFDAQKAVNTLNMGKMRDRTVTLSILHSA